MEARTHALPQARTRPGNPSRPAAAATSSTSNDWKLLLFVAIHAPLAILLRASPMLPTWHALASVAAGVWWASAGRRLDRAVYAACYAAGSEVLWRMTGIHLFWEYGKYGTSLILILVLIQLPSYTKTEWTAVGYLALLMPSAFITVHELGLSGARDAISFNLSGPFSLTVAILFFSSVRASALDLKVLILSLLAPITGVLTICSYSTVVASAIEFYAESNYVTSGGFGPNQVSSVLGLGALLSLFVFLQSSNRLFRGFFLALTVAFLTQGVLTFSRGGVINAMICIGFLTVHLINQPRVRNSLFAVLVALTFVGWMIVIPRLNAFTGGALEERYTTTETGMRQTIAEEELQLWKDNPVFGVGPGMAKFARRDPLGMEVAAHTEFTRALAEHGTFGLFALLMLVFIGGRAYLLAPTSLEKAWVSSFAAWTLVEMSHSAMRVVVISLLFGMATLQWDRRTR
jgi:O-antigen ligase